MFNFTPFPILISERLILRKLELKDEQGMFQLRTDLKVNKYLDRPEADSVEAIQKLMDKLNAGIRDDKWIYWAISLKEEAGLIGTICLWNISKEKLCAEIGFELLPDFQGKGLMREAVSKVVTFGFEKMQLEKIEAWTNAENVPSINLLKKFNFRKDIGLENKHAAENKLGNMAIYVLDR